VTATRRPQPFPPAPPLLLITDRTLAGSPLEQSVARALDAGLRWLLLRDKGLPAGQRHALAERLRQEARARGALFLVSSDTALAEAVAAHGVHLPAGGDPIAARARLGAEALIGCSTHGRAEAEAAFRRGADYVTLSPVFASLSKPGYGPALGLEALAEAAAALDGPVIALGGITWRNAAACVAAGCAGVAVMGAILQADDPGRATRRLVGALAG